MSADPTQTLEAARVWLRKRFDDGAECPCCRQHVQRYRRTITGTMAKGLIALYAYHIGKGHDWARWCHIPTIMRTACPSNMGALLRFWGLIEGKGGTREDGSHRTGMYRITPLGIAFVENKAKIPKYVHLYNQELLAIETDKASPTISIIDALGQRFNYAELMAGGASSPPKAPTP